MKKGFTLIELMIVVAIIAIIAAIAIPSLLRARQAANETNASAACKGMTAHQAVFRRTDADGNGVQDYWCADIAAFYAMKDGEGNLLKYIDVAFAKADYAPLATGSAGYNGTAPHAGGFDVAVPKAGYHYIALTTDENGNAYASDTNLNDGIAGNAWNNKSDWAVCAFAYQYNKDGIRTFIVNCEGVVYGVDNKSDADGCGDQVLTWPDADPTTQTGASGKRWSVVQE